MGSLSRWVVRHRSVVGLVWLAITMVGLLLAPSVSGRLKSGIQLNSAAYTANEQLAEQYGGSASDPGVVVIDLPNGTTVQSTGVAAKLRGLDAQIARGMPGLREISYASTGNEALLGNGGRNTILLRYEHAGPLSVRSASAQRCMTTGSRRARQRGDVRLARHGSAG